MKDLYIIGAGGFGREVLTIAKDIEPTQDKWRIKGFLNSKEYMDAIDDIDTGEYTICESLESHIISDENVYVFAIADVNVRERMCTELSKKGAEFINLIHPTAYVTNTSVLGNGIIITPLSLVSVNTFIGNHVIINGARVGHDAIIKDYCTLGPQSCVLGYCTVEKKVTLGCNACIHPHVRVSEGTIVGMGSVVIRNTPPNSTIFGIPAVKI